MTCKMVRSNGGGSCGRRFVASPEDLPYIVWDSTVNNIDEYGPAPSLHSHPASIITYNHIPPMINSCQASSTISWDSSTFSRRCCSPACCAILLTAILILAALLTVIGVAVYLGIITNLSKATILPVSGRFRVISGDDFVPSLYNSSSTSFLEKAEKYNAIIHSAFQWTSIENAIIKNEVYAFRKGSLIVHFRVYLDRKKILKAQNALAFGRNNIEPRSSSSSSSSSSSHHNDNLIPLLVQNEMREGLVQLRMVGPGRPEIDLDSLTVTSYHTDPMLNLKDQSVPLQITRGNVFYERNDSELPVDSVLTAIHLKPLKQSTRKPTLLQVATRSTTPGTTSTTTTTTTTAHPFISSKFNNKYQKPLVLRDDNGNILPPSSTNQHNRRYSNDHQNDSLINRFGGRLKPSRPSLTTVRPVTSSTISTTTTTATTLAPTTIKSTSTTSTPKSTATSTTTTTSTTTIIPPLSSTRRVRLPSSSSSTTTTTTTTTAPEPPPIVYTDESIRLTSKDPNLFTHKTTRTRIDFPSLLAGLRSTTTTTTTTTTPVPEQMSTISLGTVSPIPPNHKPPPGTSIKVTSLDFGQWRPLSPFKPLNQPKLPIKLTPSSPFTPLLSPPFTSQVTHLKPGPPGQRLSPSPSTSSSHEYNPNLKNRLGFRPGQIINKMPMVIAVSPGEHIRRRIPITVL